MTEQDPLILATRKFESSSHRCHTLYHIHLQYLNATLACRNRGLHRYCKFFANVRFQLYCTVSLRCSAAIRLWSIHFLALPSWPKYQLCRHLMGIEISSLLFLPLCLLWSVAWAINFIMLIFSYWRPLIPKKSWSSDFKWKFLKFNALHCLIKIWRS